MEEWSFVGELELEGWKGPRICLTFHHFTYGEDTNCKTLLDCNNRRKQLQQWQHLIKTCKLWSTHFHEQPGWEEPKLGANQGIKKEGDQAFVRGCEESNLVGN